MYVPSLMLNAVMRTTAAGRDFRTNTRLSLMGKRAVEMLHEEFPEVAIIDLCTSGGLTASC